MSLTALVRAALALFVASVAAALMALFILFEASVAAALLASLEAFVAWAWPMEVPRMVRCWATAAHFVCSVAPPPAPRQFR